MGPPESNSFLLAYHRGWLWAALAGMKTPQPTGTSHHHCWEPGGAPAAGGFASLLPLSFPCLGVFTEMPAPPFFWQCGCLDEAKPMLYPEIIFSQANMLCSAFPRAGDLPLSSAHPCVQTLDDKGHGRDAAANPSPAACPKPPACFDHLGSLLKQGPYSKSVNVTGSSGSWLPFPLDGPGVVHGSPQAPEISFLGHIPNSRLSAGDRLPQRETRAKLPPPASYQVQANTLSQVQLLLAPKSVGPCQPWGLHPTLPPPLQRCEPQHCRQPSEEATLGRWGEHIAHLVCERLVHVQYRGAIRRLIRPSTVLPLKSISRVLADCSLFGITDVSRVGERLQEAPERRICALAGVGE